MVEFPSLPVAADHEPMRAGPLFALLTAGTVAIQGVVLVPALGPVCLYAALLLVLPLVTDAIRARRGAAGARHRALLWVAAVLALETAMVGGALAAGRESLPPGPMILHLAPLALAGAALWLLCAPRSGAVAAGAPLPWWIAPLGAVSALALEVLLASTGRAERALLPRVALGRGRGELALLLALCAASRLPGWRRTLAMPALAATAVTLVAALGGPALLTNGNSLEGEGLLLIAAGGAIFGLACDAALDRPQRLTRAVAGVLGYAAGAAPLLAGWVLATGAAVLVRELPRVLAFALLHGLLLGWATPNGRATDPLAPRCIGLPRPPSLRRAVALTVFLPWLWFAALWLLRAPGEVYLILCGVAIGISVLSALPALVRRPTAHLWMHGQLAVAVPVVLVLAMVIHHDAHRLLAQVAVLGLSAASFWLVARAARRLGDPDVLQYFGVGAPAQERPASPAAPPVRAVVGAAAVGLLVLSLPAATRCAGRWHLAAAPMAVATASGPDGRISPHAAAMPAFRTGSALALDPERNMLYVADADRGELVAIDADHMTVRARRRVGAQPTQLTLGADGTVFASVRGTGELVAWAPSGQLRGTRVGAEPWGLARSDDGETVFVSLASGNEVVALDARSLSQKWRTAVAERPRALAVTPAGKLLVGHVRHSALSVLDGRTGKRLHELPLAADAGATPTQAWAFAGAGDAMIVLHAQVRTGVDTPPVASGTYGGGETVPMVARLTQIDGRRVSVVDVPEPLRDQALLAPRSLSQLVAAAYLGSGRFAVADLGGDIVDVISAAEEHRSAEVPGGPAALAADPTRHRLYVWAAFDRKLRAFRMGESHAPGEEADLWLGPSGLPQLAETGRRLFHLQDPRISQQRLACASCHPEGREDGLVWRLEGARRQTPSLAGRLADSAPYNWLGTQPTLEGNLAQTIQRLGGSGLEAAETRALAAYIRDYLPAPKAPQLEPEGAADQLVRRGQRIFRRKDVGCAGCHLPEAGFSDGLRHNIGTTSAQELRELRSLAPGAAAPAYDTPSLRQLALTAPYLHDGSARDLDELLRRTDGAMGHTRHLRKDERRALLAYLASL